MPETIIKTETFIKYLPHELTDEIVENATIMVFDDLEITSDEIAEYEDGKVRISSYQNGLIDWNEEKGQYIYCYHWSCREVGQLQYVLVVNE